MNPSEIYIVGRHKTGHYNEGGFVGVLSNGGCMVPSLALERKTDRGAVSV